MTEMIGYNGPIYMTQPTKALCPVLLVSSCVNKKMIRSGIAYWLVGIKVMEI